MITLVSLTLWMWPPEIQLTIAPQSLAPLAIGAYAIPERKR